MTHLPDRHPQDSGRGRTAARLIGVSLIGTAAAIGLILFFVGAVYTHVRASDYSTQFGLAIGFLSLAVATLVLGLAWSAEAGQPR